MKKEYIIILLVVGVGVYFFMKETPQKKQLSNNEDEQDVIDDGECSDGIVDECGVCNGDGAIYECGCTDVIDENCDCDGNVLDACGECGGGQGNPSLCSGEVGDEGTMTWNGRDYTTQIVEYSDGTRLEWMTENAKAVDETYYSSIPSTSTSTRWGIYGLPENMQEAIQDPNGAFEKYGGLYNKNVAGYLGAPQGWRLPTILEFQGLMSIEDEFGYLYNMNDLCSVEDWDEGLEGSNESGMNFKGGGFYPSSNVANLSQDIGVKGVYVTNQGSPRTRVVFDPNSDVLEVIETSALSSLRLVRIPSDVLDV